MSKCVKYSIDSDTLITTYRYYPPDLFGPMWDELSRLTDDGILISPRQVKDELSVKADEIYDWAKEHSHMFLAVTPEVEKAVEYILSEFEDLIDYNSVIEEADPFVIALARAENAGVVTQESRRGPGGKPNIPNVCDALDIPCMNFLGFMRERGWSFQLRTP